MYDLKMNVLSTNKILRSDDALTTQRHSSFMYKNNVKIKNTIHTCGGRGGGVGCGGGVGGGGAGG